MIHTKAYSMKMSLQYFFNALVKDIVENMHSELCCKSKTFALDSQDTFKTCFLKYN